MPKYDIFAVCNACGDEHSTGLSVFLDTDPPKRQSVAAAYSTKKLPSNLGMLKDVRVYARERAGNMRRLTTSKFFWFVSAEAL